MRNLWNRIESNPGYYGKHGSFCSRAEPPISREKIRHWFPVFRSHESHGSVAAKFNPLIFNAKWLGRGLLDFKVLLFFGQRFIFAPDVGGLQLSESVQKM